MKHHIELIRDYVIQNATAFGLAFLALLARLMLIYRFQNGGYDLQIYHYFADLILKGLNPYQVPLNGPINPQYADMSPFNWSVFAAVLLIKNSPLTLRLFFAVIDFIVMLAIGLGVKRSKDWRTALMLFYGFNPFVLMSLVVVSEDKVIIFGLLLLVFILAESRNAIGAILVTTILTIYKWMGAFFFMPLAFYLAKRKRDLFLYFSIFISLFAVSHLPYFPDNLLAYEYREARTLINPPTHSSITMLLALAGVYHPIFVRVLIAVSLISLNILFFIRKVGIKETIVLSVFFSYIGAPEIGFDRIVLITMPFFFIVELSKPRLVTIWIVTTIASIALFVNIGGLPMGLGTVAIIAKLSEVVFGKYASIQHVVFMNLFPALMLFYYFRDKLAGKLHTDDRLQYSLVQFLRQHAG